MADFNEPTNTSLYSGIWATVRSLIASAAKMDFTGDTNVPTNAKRWDSTTKKFQYWNGSSWVDLATNFVANVGIGQTSPSYALDIGDGSTVTQQVLRLNTATGSGGGGSGWFALAGSVTAAIGHYSSILGGSYLGALTLWAGTGNEVRVVTNGTERARFDSSGNVFFPSVSTTASAANAFLNNATSPVNSLLRSTSSIRYKRDVEDLDPAFADKVLELRPVFYRSKAEADPQEWSYYGLIAEEVAEVEPRLVQWSYRDEDRETVVVGYQTNAEGNQELDADGNPIPVYESRIKPGAEKVPDGMQYDRVAVLLLSVVKRQEQRIQDLETRLAALEAKVG